MLREVVLTPVVVAERSQDLVEYQVQLPPNIFSKESQHQVSALLQQLILAWEGDLRSTGPAIAFIGVH